jgi:hypothetical protein
MHDPKAFNSVVEAFVDEALAARSDNSQRNMRTPRPCRYCTEAGLPMADRLHWHQDCPLPLHASHHLDRKPPHQQYRQQPYKHQQYKHEAPHPSSFRRRGRGPRGRDGRRGSHGRGGRGTPSRDAPLGHPSVSHTNVVPRSGDVASAQHALVSFFDLEGAPSINMSKGFRAGFGLPLPLIKSTLNRLINPPRLSALMSPPRRPSSTSSTPAPTSIWRLTVPPFSMATTPGFAPSSTSKALMLTFMATGSSSSTN